MKLEKFQEKKKKKTALAFFTACCILLVAGMFLYQTFALFETKENFNFIEGQVQDPGNLSFVYYIDGTISREVPEKNTGYQYVSSNCNDGVIMDWNYETWSPFVKKFNETRVKCKVYFEKKYEEAVLNGAYPILKDELIPVTIENDGTVKKADLRTEWYSYTKKNWANAIIKRNSYVSLNNEGKVHGASKQEGYVTLDGVDDYIDLGLANYDFQNNISFVLKFSLDKIHNNQTLIGNWETAGGGIYIHESKLCYELYNASTSSYDIGSCVSDFVPQLNEEYTVVFTFNGEKYQFFLNGNLVDEKNISANISPSIAFLSLGCNPFLDTCTTYSQVNVYQAAIYNRALTIEEIKENFKDYIQIKSKDGLLKYVDFTDRVLDSNEILVEDDIESYFVWVPRYRYKIFNDTLYNGLTNVDNAKVQEIKLEFETKYKKESSGTGIGEWLTHPAFTSFDSNGMWVGKFETSKSNSEADNSKNAEGVQIKPNVVSWRNIQVANAFSTSFLYKRELESHMMKNIEWGSVAYLQHSKYGSMASVRINNNSDYITGYASVNVPTCGYTFDSRDCNTYGTTEDITKPYNTEVGYLASTTGNISGIYDMSGGAWEYVMAGMKDENGVLMNGRNDSENAGFGLSIGFKDEKYFDVYEYGTNYKDYTRRILGDATGEMGPFQEVSYVEGNNRQISSWYANHAFYVHDYNPWFARGCDYSDGSEAGIFAFGRNTGAAYKWMTFRVILTP